jgi:hypothetical protein
MTKFERIMFTIVYTAAFVVIMCDMLFWRNM